MSRTLLAGLALIGLIACGGSAENQAAANTRTRATKPSTTAPKRSTTASKPSTKQSKRKATTPTDTSKRSPLTNR
jgi:hypothetical protein